MIDNRKQIIHGDSLFFNDSTGFGESFRNVVIEDTVNKIAVEGNYAWYYKQPEKFFVTDRAVFIQISKQDSLFLHADTIKSITVTDTLGKVLQTDEGILWLPYLQQRSAGKMRFPFIFISGFSYQTLQGSGDLVRRRPAHI